MNKLPLKAILIAIFCNVLFGSAGPFIKLGFSYFGMGSDAFSNILFAGIRFFCSGLIVLAVDACRRKSFPRVHPENRLNVVLIALTYTFLQYLFNYVGLSHISGTTASVLSSTTTFFSILIAHFFCRNDRLNLRKVLGCLSGFAGIVLICTAGASPSDPASGGFSLLGEGSLLIGALFFSVGSLFLKKGGQRDPGFTLTAYNLTIGGGLLTVVGLCGFRSSLTVTLPGILVLLYLIFISSVGFTLWSILLSKYPIGLLSVFNFLIPISGTVISGIILKENILRWENVLSLLLVTAGIFIINRPPRRASQPPEEAS